MCILNRTLLLQGGMERGWRECMGSTEQATAATREMTMAWTTYTVVDDKHGNGRKQNQEGW